VGGPAHTGRLGGCDAQGAHRRHGLLPVRRPRRGRPRVRVCACGEQRRLGHRKLQPAAEHLESPGGHLRRLEPELLRQRHADGQPLGAPVTAAPYSLTWDTRNVTNGTHVLSARAVDLAGNTATSAGVSVNVSNAPDTTPPAVRITYPLNGFGASGPIVLSSVA